jgi:hypothetical protein
MNKKRVLYVLSYLVCLALGICIGEWHDISRNWSTTNIKFEELEEVADTAYYTGKDVSASHSFLSPTQFEEGVIPDAATAAKIAYLYVAAVYGEDHSVHEQPYQIRLINKQIWTIEGYLSPYALGGTFYICIEKYTGKIWAMNHGK